ncbi:hypothetical protein DVH05_027721 [Phytophthora capsici]|nr:hypothetical protein DVH05_027721 [Phytophthora capsici]
MAHGRRKKRRVAATTPQEEEAARQRFLEALEAQRANARNAEPAETQATPAPAEPLPGFYYDETKRRYFRFSPASERRQQEKLERQQQKEQIHDRKVEFQVKSRRTHGINGHNWVAYMAQRQSDYTWSARKRDNRELMPKMLSDFLSSQVVKSQDVEINGRLTALALHPRASNLGALGASSGRLDILGLQRLPPESASESPTQEALPICNFDIQGIITSLQWRPVQELDILVCQLGSGQRNSSRTPPGRVCLLRVGDQETRGVALVSTARMKRLAFPDPWTAKWNPTDTRKFCVGYGGRKLTAAYVDGVADTSEMLLAPVGKISSAVHAQSFFPTGNVVLNGTKSGGLWGWDIRTPRRIFEWEGEVSPDKPAGSVLDLHMLSDCRRAVVQRSNGELRVVDLRSSKPVVEFMAGAPKRYLPSLRCAIDNNESVVVAGGDEQHPLTVKSFDLRDGRCVSSVEMQNTAQTEKRSTLVQQVQLKSGHYGSRYENTPEIWAISRNELYVCSGRKDNSDE